VFGTYFIAMEYVPGHTLKQLVEHCASDGRRGAASRSRSTSRPSSATRSITRNNRCDERGKPLGIVHRDVSPANIILSEHGLVKLIDFGLARAAVHSENTEQARSRASTATSRRSISAATSIHRADLWAVGIIMYELLTSRRLFDGPDAFETMMRVKQLPIPRPSLANPRVRPELDVLVMTALERDVNMRWQSAEALGDATHRHLSLSIALPGAAITCGIASPSASADCQRMLTSRSSAVITSTSSSGRTRGFASDGRGSAAA